jgi:hypothetical protein
VSGWGWLEAVVCRREGQALLGEDSPKSVSTHHWPSPALRGTSMWEVALPKDGTSLCSSAKNLGKGSGAWVGWVWKWQMGEPELGE